MTEEQALAQATQEIEDAKPMYGQSTEKGRYLYTDSDYQQAIKDRKESLLDDYNFGYIQARQQAYGSVQDQLDMQYWDGVNGTTLWADHIAQVKADNPKPA